MDSSRPIPTVFAIAPHLLPKSLKQSTQPPPKKSRLSVVTTSGQQTQAPAAGLVTTSPQGEETIEKPDSDWSSSDPIEKANKRVKYAELRLAQLQLEVKREGDTIRKRNDEEKAATYARHQEQLDNLIRIHERQMAAQLAQLLEAHRRQMAEQRADYARQMADQRAYYAQEMANQMADHARQRAESHTRYDELLARLLPPVPSRESADTWGILSLLFAILPINRTS
ncbi:hypothetical protein BDN72DRAFT_960215 [Pluteus cervinus]|uniref:Uncharacterized protein n=1 Tax=Pluteus cervinus TaxID=181527 RepID=A0ACD3AS21_9AGAR|nr:hypothetical protein BDN72DRAFT_960215 [Pluteus cervinus]